MSKRNHNFIHGMADSRAYGIWRHMINRCTSTKNIQYHNYGGRGIKVCDKWQTFEGFWEDMKDGYSDNLSIDRIDNDGNYCKENCRWTTLRVQSRNRRTNITYNGECAYDASIRLGGKRGLISQRVATRGWSLEKAFTTPVLRESVHKPKAELNHPPPPHLTRIRLLHRTRGGTTPCNRGSYQESERGARPT